jgi:hypothetical protein
LCAPALVGRPGVCGGMNGRAFHLLRHHDLHGISGEGIVADGICHDQHWTFPFPDGPKPMPPGWCELKWRGGLTSTSLWQSVGVMMSVHGHDGATELVWEP